MRYAEKIITCIPTIASQALEGEEQEWKDYCLVFAQAEPTKYGSYETKKIEY